MPRGATETATDRTGPEPGAGRMLDPAARAGRIRIALVLIALIPVTVWWLQRLVDAPANGWFEGTTTFEIGSDFTVFYTAGALVAEGNSHLIYDVERFQDEYRQRIDLPLSENSSFGNTPAVAVLMAPLSSVSWHTAWVIWTVLGLAALAASLALLGARNILGLAGVLVLTLPVYFAITFGQGTLFWLLIIAAIFHSFSRNRIALGGGLAGLLILKPTLLLGLALWWLIDRTKRPALGAAVGTAAVVILITLPFVGTAWLDFPGAALDFADRHSTLDAQWAQFSPWGFFNLLLPDVPALAALAGALAAAGGVAGFIWFYRRHRSAWQLLFAAAVVLTLWISPQVVAYEWTLLIAAGLVLWRTRTEFRALWLDIGIALAIAAVWSILLSNELRPSVGWAFQFAVVVYAVAAWWAARRVTVVAPR